MYSMSSNNQRDLIIIASQMNRNIACERAKRIFLTSKLNTTLPDTPQGSKDKFFFKDVSTGKRKPKRKLLSPDLVREIESKVLTCGELAALNLAVYLDFHEY